MMEKIAVITGADGGMEKLAVGVWRKRQVIVR